MIWAMVPTWLKRGLAALAAGVVLLWGAWMAGKRQGTSQANAKRAEDNLKAAKTAKDIRHEIETSDDQRLVDILTGKLHDKR